TLWIFSSFSIIEFKRWDLMRETVVDLITSLIRVRETIGSWNLYWLTIPIVSDFLLVGYDDSHLNCREIESALSLFEENATADDQDPNVQLRKIFNSLSLVLTANLSEKTKALCLRRVNYYIYEEYLLATADEEDSGDGEGTHESATFDRSSLSALSAVGSRQKYSEQNLVGEDILSNNLGTRVVEYESYRMLESPKETCSEGPSMEDKCNEALSPVL
ncbi:hypothetical protein MPH_13857, partial [Macrophomina phaseolina MS6]